MSNKIDLVKVKSWLSSIMHSGEYLHITEDTETHLRAHFYTTQHKFTISAHYDESKGNNYLGAVFSNRKPRPGEDWTRGGDLPDGPITKELWDCICRRIIKVELLQIAPAVVRMVDEG